MGTGSAGQFSTDPAQKGFLVAAGDPARRSRSAGPGLADGDEHSRCRPGLPEEAACGETPNCCGGAGAACRAAGPGGAVSQRGLHVASHRSTVSKHFHSWKCQPAQNLGASGER